MVGINSLVDITGGNGFGVVVGDVHSPAFSTDFISGIDPLMDPTNGIVAVGENLEVNLYQGETGEGAYFGGMGTGVSVNLVEGLTVLGSLQDWLTYLDFPTGWFEDSDSNTVPWDGDHHTHINVYGDTENGFAPRVGLSANNDNAIFASGIDVIVPDGIGAIFGNGLFECLSAYKYFLG